MASNIQWPTKTERCTPITFDSTIWNDFNSANDDIIICDICQVRYDVDATNHRADVARPGSGTRGRGHVAVARLRVPPKE